MCLAGGVKFPPGMCLAGSVKFLIYFLDGGLPGSLETPVATPLRPAPPVPTPLYKPILAYTIGYIFTLAVGPNAKHVHLPFIDQVYTNISRFLIQITKSAISPLSNLTIHINR